LGVEACRLAALKPFKRLKPVKSFLAAQPRRQKLPQQAPQGHSDGSTPQAKATSFDANPLRLALFCRAHDGRNHSREANCDARWYSTN